MDIFSLTETEFFRQLTAGENENIHVTYRDFVIRVAELCNQSQRTFAVDALLFIEIEISHLQTEHERGQVNKSIAVFISKALRYIREKLSHIKTLPATSMEEEDVVSEIDLKWRDKKVGLVEMGYAFKLAKCFGENNYVKEIVLKLAKAFQVEITENYIYKKYNEIKVRGRNSRTYFMDMLADRLKGQMSVEDDED